MTRLLAAPEYVVPGAVHVAPVTVDERWVEVDYGEFECQPLGDIPADVWQRWMADRHFRTG